MKTKWSGLALEAHTSVAIDEVESIWPARIRNLGVVFKSIDQCRELDSQLPHTRSRNLGALVEVLRACEHNLVANIALHLPDVARMRFQDVYGVEHDIF